MRDLRISGQRIILQEDSVNGNERRAMSPRNLFQKELEDLRNHVRQMGEHVQNSYNQLEDAWKSGKMETLQSLLDTDRQVREVQREIEAQCLMLMTRQQPVARDLRLITAALKAVTDVERVGDHVGDIAELYLRLKYDAESSCVAVLEKMYLEVQEMFRQSIEAFVEGDVKSAELVIARDDVVDDYFNEMKEKVMEGIRHQSMDADTVVDCLMVAKYLEKIGDHAENIGEWTVFQITGDMDGVKLY